VTGVQTCALPIYVTSGLPERGYAVDPAHEQHALLVDARIAQAVGRGLPRVLRPDLVELLRDALAARRILALLGFHRALDLHPVVRIVGIHDQERELGARADPAALRPVRGRVDEDLVALVVEPHRRETDPPVRADQAQDYRDRPVEQCLVDRVQVRDAGDLRALTDGELPALPSVGDVLELRDSDLAHRLSSANSFTCDETLREHR